MKCIYTVITGGYDALKEPEYITPGWDYICFTDNPSLTSKNWEVRVMPALPKETPHQMSRRIKLLPHKYLEEYNTTLYIDAAYKVVNDLNLFTDPILSDISLVIRDINRSVTDELDDLVKYKTFTEEQARNQREMLKEMDFSFSRGTYYMGGLILRVRSEFSDKFMQAWFDLTLKFHRDQAPLHYLLEKYDYKPGEFSTRQIRQYFSYHFHNPKLLFSDSERNPRVFYFTPASPDKNIGPVYNAHCASVPNNEDWICIRDGDTMFLTHNWSEIITSAIKRYPDTALFGCYTNRVGLDYQLTEHGFSEDPNILNHAQIARDRWEKYGSECVEIQKPVAGMFMLFRRSVWTRVPFKDKLVVGNKFFDWDFGERIVKLGGKVRLIKGLYLMHYYRFDTSREDKSHLL